MTKSDEADPRDADVLLAGADAGGGADEQAPRLAAMRMRGRDSRVIGSEPCDGSYQGLESRCTGV
jgi:hypothetical protein